MNNTNGVITPKAANVTLLEALKELNSRLNYLEDLCDLSDIIVKKLNNPYTVSTPQQDAPKAPSEDVGTFPEEFSKFGRKLEIKLNHIQNGLSTISTMIS